MTTIITNDDIDYLQNQPDIPLILSGMMSLLQDSDNKVEEIQKQNWFQRMWKTVTGKNKATANEVQQNHEKLSAYMTQAMEMLYERNVMTQQMVNNLGLQLNVLYQEHNHLKEMLGAFVEKLNEKIVSIDNFHMLSEEIRLKMYANDKPVIAICKVVTQLDERTVNDPRKMQILQQSLVQEGILSENPIPLQELFMDLLTCTPEEAGQFILGLGAIRQHYLPSLFLEFLETYYYMSDMERKMKSKEKFCANYLDIKQIESSFALTSFELYQNNVETFQESFGLLYNLTKSGANYTPLGNSSPLSDFEIKNGCLVKYTGDDEEVYIPDTVSEIGESAFEDNGTLIYVGIPHSVTRIGKSAFSGCSSLASINIPNSVTLMEEFAFYWCTSLASVTISNSLKVIEEEAFSSCSSLKSVVIPNMVTIIGDSAFDGCESLESVTLPNSLESIGNSAFSCCLALETVTIPKLVKQIGEKAFQYCSDLYFVHYEGREERIFFDEDVFRGTAKSGDGHTPTGDLKESLGMLKGTLEEFSGFLSDRRSKLDFDD